MRNGLTETNGIHFVIEDSEKSPSIISNGISVQPGTEANIGMEKTEISRLKDPFESSCVESYETEIMAGIHFLEQFEYSSNKS